MISIGQNSLTGIEIKFQLSHLTNCIINNFNFVNFMKKMIELSIF